MQIKKSDKKTAEQTGMHREQILYFVKYCLVFLGAVKKYLSL